MSNKRFALILANQLANPHRQWIGLIDAGVQACRLKATFVRSSSAILYKRHALNPVSHDPTQSSVFIFRGIAAGTLTVAVLACWRFMGLEQVR